MYIVEYAWHFAEPHICQQHLDPISPSSCDTPPVTCHAPRTTPRSDHASGRCEPEKLA